jgi:hypothetical protein
MIRCLLLSDRCNFVDVGRHLWREDGSALCNCSWSSPAQSFSGPSPTGLVTIFYCLRLETPLTWEARSPYLYPPKTRWPSYTPGTAFPFRQTLRPAGLRWRCSNPSPHGVLNFFLHGFATIMYLIFNNSSVVASTFVAIETCLPSRCLAMVGWSGFCILTVDVSSHSTILAWSHHITIC